MNQFPDLQNVSNTFVEACQALGLGLLAVMICLVALMIFTSLGNEHRQMYARLAVFGIPLVCSQERRLPAARESSSYRVRDQGYLVFPKVLERKKRGQFLLYSKKNIESEN